MILKPIKVPVSFKSTSYVFDDEGRTRHLGEIVKLARKNGYNPPPAPVLDDNYEPVSKATKREVEDFRRIMNSLQYPESFDIEV